MNVALQLLFFLSLLPVWHTDIADAMKEAEKEDKTILMVFSGSDWCIPCARLKKDILSDSQFIAFAEENLVLMQVDFPRYKKNSLPSAQVSKNEVLAEKYNREGLFPKILLLDQKGEVIAEIEYTHQEIDEFLDLLRKVL